MFSARLCEACQTRLLPDAPENLCPACLLKFALTGQLAEPQTAGTARSAPVGPAATVFVFGDFEIHDELARGGMGVVYRARQISLNRPVALKVILVGRWASETQIERFQIEAEAAAKLTHPNIVPVLEIGEIDGQHYLSMPLIEGGNLATRLNELRADPTNRRGVAVVAKVARAVHYAHDRRVLHRDLKPTNVLLDLQGEPHLTDFGLAKVVENDSSFTRTIAVLGTPGYMAPEQAAGEARRADARADVYSVGAILYELLTGQPPFVAPTPLETLELVRDAAPSSPSRLNPRVDRDLETVCLKCLRKEPSGRYPSAQALAEDLERWLEGRPVLARRPTVFERLWLWSRRQPAAAAVVLLLLLIALGLLLVAQDLREQRDQARRNLWQSHLAQAASIRATSEAGRRERALKVLEEAAAIRPSLEVRNEVIAALALDDLRVRHRWAGFPDGTTAFATEARQRHYARADNQGAITVREVGSDRELANLAGPSAGSDWLRFSPDGRFLAARFGTANRTAELHVWDWRRGEDLMKLPLPPKRMVPVDFSSDNESIFVGTANGTIRQISIHGGELVASFDAGFPPAEVRSAPNGKWLAIEFNHDDASVAHNAMVKVLNLQSREEVVFEYSSGNVRSLAWHPSGELLAVGCNGNRSYEEHIAPQKRVKVYEPHETPVLGCAYNFDGTLLAMVEYDGTVSIWDALEGRKILSTRVHSAELSFAPGSSRLAVGIDPPEVRLWEMAPQTAHFNVPQTRIYCSGLAFSPEGRWIVMANPFGGLLVVDLNQHRSALWHPVTGIRSVWFDREGRHIVTSGHAGLQRWPFEIRAGHAQSISFGPPERFDVPSQRPLEYAAASPDGRRVAVIVDFAELLLGEFGDTTNWHTLNVGRPKDLSFSPDNRWLATASTETEGMGVWDLRTRTPVLREAVPATDVVFSPDGRWLAAVVGRAFRIWQAGSWKLLRELHGEGVEGVEHPFDFSPDGRLLALVRRLKVVQLVDLQTGEELATLQAPDASTIQWVKFSPDGRHVAVLTRTRGLHVWNLPALRIELARMGLDWGGPGQSTDD